MSVEVSDWSIHTVKLTNLPKYFFHFDFRCVFELRPL